MKDDYKNLLKQLTVPATVDDVKDGQPAETTIDKSPYISEDTTSPSFRTENITNRGVFTFSASKCTRTEILPGIQHPSSHKVLCQE